MTVNEIHKFTGVRYQFVRNVIKGERESRGRRHCEATVGGKAWEEVKRIDALGRMNLGKDLANETFMVQRYDDGSMLLTPVAVIPKRELWLWRDQEALEAVKRGLEQSARGEVKSLGSFAAFAEDPKGR